MPPRREPPSSDNATEPRQGRQARRRPNRSRPPRQLGLRLRASLVAGLGAVGSLSLLALIWPPRDRAYEPKPDLTPATLADRPQRPVTVLLIGSDAERLAAPSNGAAPPGPANADALLLLRVAPQGPLQVLNLPTELAVRLPGGKRPVALGSLYRSGGVALLADAVRELTGLPAPAPDRYLVLPRGALRTLIEAIGGVEVDPPRSIRYRDRAQKLTIELQGGLQRLNGLQLEQLVRYRDPVLGEEDRRLTQQRVQTALRERLGQSEPLRLLPSLLPRLEGLVQTNLSLRETLSLLAAGLEPRQPIRFVSLPLDPPRPSHGRLRQLSASSPSPLWPLTTP